MGARALLFGALLAFTLTACGSPAQPSNADGPSSAVPASPGPDGSGRPPIFAGSSYEYFERLAGCLHDQGFAAEVTPDRALRYDFGSAEQQPAFDAAMDACESEVGIMPPPEPLSEAELVRLYESYLTARSCLIGLGYSLPEPPSEDAFVDTYATDPWSPFNDLDVTGGDAWAEITAACPQG